MEYIYNFYNTIKYRYFYFFYFLISYLNIIQTKGMLIIIDIAYLLVFYIIDIMSTICLTKL